MTADSSANLSPSVSGTTRAPRRIAILTAGGDAPGMNAAIRAVVRTAAGAGIEVLGVHRGFDGLIKGDFEPLPSRAVANIIQRAGTALGTSRSTEFLKREGREKAAKSLRERDVEWLVVIGGEGTLTAGRVFTSEWGIPVMAVPASIDNDVPGTDYSVGFDTAVNTALEAIDRIRDTAFAYERIFCIEVMGRDSGFIATAVAIGAGAEAVIVPEIRFDVARLLTRVEEARQRGKMSSIIVVSEGPRTGGVMPIARALHERFGVEPRVAVLGYIQRGGSPTARDRVLASRMGSEAVRAIIDGVAPSMVGERHTEIVRVEFTRVDEFPRALDTSLIKLVETLSI